MGCVRADAGATRYSPLDEIRAGNVGDLEVAWRWRRTGPGLAAAVRPTQISPIVVNGVLYTTIGNQRSVIALDAATGESIWNWHPGDNERRWVRHHRAGCAERRARRDLLDGRGGRRAHLRGDAELQLVALDARTGNLVEDFGAAGAVDMMDDLRWSERPAAARAGRVANTSPAAILGNVLVASISMHTGSIPPGHHPMRSGP